MEKIVKVKGIELVVEFKVEGKYYPETRYEPAEYPEIEIKSIKVRDSNIDIYDLLDDYITQDIYTELENDYQYDE